LPSPPEASVEAEPPAEAESPRRALSFIRHSMMILTPALREIKTTTRPMMIAVIS
jgi:hypothetical protein